MKTVITAAAALTPLSRVDDAAVLIEDGRIVSCEPRSVFTIPPAAKVLDFPEGIVAPGYIDIHIHGAAGRDLFNSPPEALRSIGSFLATRGVTSFVPTTITAPLDDLLHTLEALASAIESFGSDHSVCARPIGIHLEGPFLSHARRGVHPAVYIQPPSLELFDRLWNAARGKVVLMTIAPELNGAAELIKEATGRGICVAIGHSNADFKQATAGVEAGARHATHTFNAMRRMEHRAAGISGLVLTDRRVTADIIADGQHAEPAIVDLFIRCKGLDQAVLISDATSATGMPPGRYHLGSFEVEVDGLRCESHGKLAGSVLSLDVAVRNAMNFAGLTLQDAVRLASINPARVLGIESRKGVIARGSDADLIILNSSGEVQKTFIAGRCL